jgi:ATP-dependent helicase/nuclease subunit A
MTNEIVDLAQRQQALDPHRSFIVQAPAGSGKTGLITQRFLVLLARVEMPEEIVAITFTRKAAAEMRERLLQALRLATQPLADEADDYLKQTWQLAKAALQRDAEKEWRLLRNPARLRIQTIDSLCAGLTRQLPILSKFGAQPAIADDPTGLYLDAARATLNDLESDQDWSPAIETLLDHLDNNLVVAEKMLVSMLARRDQWLRHIVNVQYDPKRRSMLEQALRNTIEDALHKARASIPAMHVSALLELLDFASSNVDENHALATCLGLTGLPEDTADALPQWRAIVELLLKSDGDWRSNPRGINARLGFPAPTSTRDKVQQQIYAAKKNELVELVNLLNETSGVQQALLDLRTLPSPSYNDAQWQVVEALCELLLVAVAHLRVVFGARGQVDFSEMAQSALAALGDEEAPSDLALALDYRIQHLLVDEFQDTSFGQFELLKRLTAGWQLDDGRTLFLVGDPMQSIYRFREAEVGLYLRARHEGIGAVALTPLTLSVNFRSQSGIVDWVNQTFAQVFPESEDVTVGAVNYSASVAFHGHDGNSVQLHPYLEQDNEAEAEQVAQLIRAAQQQYPQGSIAVLVRARSHLAEIVAALKREGIRYRAIEIEQLGHRPVVQDLYVLTRALLHPGDRLAWLALLRAPWCGLELVDLTRLAEHDAKAVIWQQLQDDELMVQLSPAGQQRLTRLRAVFVEAMTARFRYGLRHWIESVWLQLGGPACVDNATDLEDAEVFLALLQQLDSAGGLDDLTLLDERLAELWALPDIEADDRLQLMTIHKSKGLEFDTVILPNLGRRSPPDESRLLMWLERWSAGEAGELLLAPLRATGEEHDAIYSYLKSVDKRKSEYETGRVLYVAATRAKKRLHFLGHTTVKDDELRPPQSGSLLNLLWPVMEAAYQEALENYTPAEAQVLEGEQETVALLKRTSLTWQPPVPAASLELHEVETMLTEETTDLEFLWASDMARHVGTVTHRMLQHIAAEDASAWPVERIDDMNNYLEQLLLHEGVTTSDLPEAHERVRQALSVVLGDERGRWVIDSSHQEAACEYALTAVINDRVQRIVMDRTFVDSDGTRWIIDYKTGVHEGGDLEQFLDNEQQRYRAQLERYGAILSKFEQRPIMLGLYFPLYGGWRAWPYQH